MSTKLTVSYAKAKYIFLIIASLFLSCFVVCYTSDFFVYAMIDIAWCSIIVMYVIAKTRSFRMSENGKLIVLAGFFVRIVLAWVGTYGTGALAAWLRSGDQEVFLQIALQYFQRDFSESYTRYPYVVYMILQVMGPNRIMPQLINILCWFFGIRIILLITDELYGRKRILLLLLYTFMPYALLVSTQLLRESIVSLFSMLYFLYIWKWMNSGNIKYMIIALAMSLIPVVLHGGNIALIIAAFFIYMRWNHKTGEWRKLDLRWIGLILCIIMAIPLYENVLARFFEYLPGKITLEAITSKYFEPARSDYVQPVEVDNLGQFIFWSIYRMLYFWISPTPRFWNSPVDIVGFLFDSVPMIYIFLQIYKNIKRDKRHSKSLAGLYILIIYTIIYAWGTVNAGTAMRHRDQLLGIMIMAVLFDMNKVISEKDKRWEKYGLYK